MEANANDVDLGGAEGEADPFKDVPADPLPEAEPVVPPHVEDLSQASEEERLGGTDEAAAEAPEGVFPEGGEGPQEPAEELPAADPDETPAPLPEDPETAAEAPGEEPGDPPPPEPEPEPEPESPPPEPEPEPEPAPARTNKSPIRTYTVLEAGKKKGEWSEREPVIAHNPEGALRKAYKAMFAGDPEIGKIVLVVVPESNWKPQPVSAGEKSGDVPVRIG